MNTENLQEMISGISNQPTQETINEYDILYGRAKREEQIPDLSKKESLPALELQVVEKSEPVTKAQNNYQPDEEAAMISYINDLNLKLGEVTIITHWEIGQTINCFYQGKYGTNELGKISAATGIGRDTLVKACKFAKQYSKENLEMLLKGNFVMTWYQIAQHLTVEPQKVIDIYQQSPDKKQFNYDIIKFKNPSETRGKAKPTQIVEVKPAEIPIVVTPEVVTPEIIPTGLVTQKFMVFEEAPRTSENDLQKLDKLKFENEHLRKEILIRIEKIGKLEKALLDLQHEKEKYENGYHGYMHKLDKIREGLESKVPASVIIDWIENGEDD